jgi:hypothetical protein
VATHNTPEGRRFVRGCAQATEAASASDAKDVMRDARGVKEVIVGEE